MRRHASQQESKGGTQGSASQREARKAAQARGRHAKERKAEVGMQGRGRHAREAEEAEGMQGSRRERKAPKGGRGRGFIQ